MNSSISETFEIGHEWSAPDGEVRGEELEATWACFRMRVGDEVVTRFHDRTAQSVREWLVLPLYPLAEWLATHWWFLLHEPWPSVGGDHDAPYLSRHSLVAAREGYALPALEIIPQGDSVLLQWRAEEARHQRVEFLSRGKVSVAWEVVRDQLWTFVEAVVRRLEDRGISGTLLQDEWAYVQGLDSEERSFCIAASTLGVDPFDLEPECQRLMIDILGGLPEGVGLDLLAVTRLNRLERDARAVKHALERGAATAVALPVLRELRNGEALRSSGHDRAPWQTGYEAARSLRRELELEGPLSLEALGHSVGASGSFPVVEANGLADVRTIQAVLALDEQESPGFVIGSRYEEPRRFQLSRSIFEYLTRTGPALVTRAMTDRQAESRAFAAEFLVPSEELRKRIEPDRPIDEDEVRELAEEFTVDPRVIQHQVVNHGIAVLAPA